MGFNIPMGNYPLTADALALVSAGTGREYGDARDFAAMQLAERSAAARNQYAFQTAELAFRKRLASAQRVMQDKQLLEQSLSRQQQKELHQERLDFEWQQYDDKMSAHEKFLAQLGQYNTNGMGLGQVTHQSPFGNTFTLRPPELTLGGRPGVATGGVAFDPLKVADLLGDLLAKQGSYNFNTSSGAGTNTQKIIDWLMPIAQRGLEQPAAQTLDPLAGFQFHFAGGAPTNALPGLAPSGGRYRLY
jgi:hypothetical protein